jgi:predicted N-acetyltransferase YhbS
MKLTFSLATPAEAPALAALHTAASSDLTERYGAGFWSHAATEKGVLNSLRHARVILARKGTTIVGTMRLANKKPWAIDVTYFTPVKKAIYLTGMAVLPKLQRQGIGRMLLQKAVEEARAWPADAIRLDAFYTDAGAGAFYARCGFREVAHVVYKKDPLIYFEFVLSQDNRIWNAFDLPRKAFPGGTAVAHSSTVDLSVFCTVNLWKWRD